MLKFFRRIRKGLLSQNRFGKYLLYAIGEIVLVREREINVLLEIKETLSENQLTLESIIEHLEKSNKSSQIVLRLLNDSITYSDTLSFHFDRAQWSSSGLIEGLSDAGYIGLGNVGFDILSNSDLRKQIIKYFSKDYQVLISSFNLKSELHANYDEYIRRNFIDFGGPRSLPLNPEMILNDNYYRSIILTIYDHRKGLWVRTQNFHIKNIKLLQTIQDEINKRT
jgi:hypothetical protein